MRSAVIVVILAATGTGCHGTRFGRLADARCGPEACGPAVPGQPCPPPAPAAPAPGPQYPPPAQPCPPPGQPCPPPQPREAPPPRPREAKAPPEEVETRQAAAAVTQDILLIPRTVYVPYAPHVPVAPARLGLATPAGRVVQTEERTRELCPPAAPRDLTADALDKCLEEMRKLNRRIADLETRAAPPPPAAPPVCPPAAPYCPAPVPPAAVCPPVIVGPDCPPGVPVTPAVPHGGLFPGPAPVAPAAPPMSTPLPPPRPQ